MQKEKTNKRSEVICNQCGKVICPKELASIKTADGDIAWGRFCELLPDGHIEILLVPEDYSRANLHFCSEDCMWEWMKDYDIEQAQKQERFP